MKTRRNQARPGVLQAVLVIVAAAASATTAAFAPASRGSQSVGRARLQSQPATSRPAPWLLHPLHVYKDGYQAGAAAAKNEEEEWYPHDPASTTPELLAGLWSQIAAAGSLVKGESITVMYPLMEEFFRKPSYMPLITAHLEYCQDVCDHFGISTTIQPVLKMGRVAGFTAKSYKNPEAKDEYDFPYDPYWDDGTDYDNLYAGIDEEEEERLAALQGGNNKAASKRRKNPYPEIVNKVPADDEEIIEVTKKWVDKICSDMGICPFTNGPNQAGLPLGNVYYCVDRSSTVEDVYARYWREVVRIESQNAKDVSTILLVLPEFLLDNVELFESFSNTLTQPLAGLQIEDLIQLVFFHPLWSFRDGGERTNVESGAAAANYARRTPWPMINILRTKQVRAAQRGIPTGLVYKQNEKTLGAIGVEQLETMLRLRDWSDIAHIKVDRKEIDALAIAREFQETGQVKPKDLSLQHDTTPAANKVDRKQVEEGNLVNVLTDALEKRLGKKKADAQVEPLSGPETSATAMATDFLMQELDRVATSAAATTTTTTTTSPTTTTAATTGAVPGSTISIPVKGGSAPMKPKPKAADRPAIPFPSNASSSSREERLAAARRALLEDITGVPLSAQDDNEDDDDDAEDTEESKLTDILFGKGGVKPRADDDSDDNTFQSGLDPKSFY